MMGLKVGTLNSTICKRRLLTVTSGEGQVDLLLLQRH